MAKIAIQLQELLREMIQYQNVEDISAHIFKQVDNLVDVFYSESEAEKYAVENLLSHYMVDELMRTERYDAPRASSAIFVVGRLVEYQSSIGGERLIDCLNRTIKAGDKLIELCQRICERHPSETEIVKKWTDPFIDMSICVYLQVGDKTNFAERFRILSEDQSRLGIPDLVPLVDLNDNEIWQRSRKEWARTLPLACIYCGKFEEKGGKKHNRCGGCLSALYCSKECQNVHWKHHKVGCKSNSRRKKSSKRGK